MWRETLESKGFRLNRDKMDYIEWKFNKRQIDNDLKVKIGEHIVPKVLSFQYLELIIQGDREINGDIIHKIQVGWMKWSNALRIIYDYKISNKLKGKFYWTAIKPIILYGSTCWALKG